MADLPSSFWGGWIAILTVTSLAGLVWLLFSVYFSKQGTEEHKNIIWDKTLNEGENPAPMWWFWFILAILIISVIYLMVFPGLGRYSGIINWSQENRIEESYSRYTNEYEPIRNAILRMSLEELHADDNAMTSAEGIFDRNCAACHGESGLGQVNRFPNLMDGIWQWGNTPARIEQTIRSGRRAVMPGWSGQLDERQISGLVQFLQDWSSGVGITENNPGKVIYDQRCANCHGTDGSGNINLGVPNLVDTVWAYGKTDAQLAETIRSGRNGTMPAFEGRLSDVQVRLLVAWLTR